MNGFCTSQGWVASAFWRCLTGCSGADYSRVNLFNLMKYPISVLHLCHSFSPNCTVGLKQNIYFFKKLSTTPFLVVQGSRLQHFPFNLWYSIWTNLEAYFLSPLGILLCWEMAVKSQSSVLFYFFIWGNVPVSRFTTCCLKSVPISSFYWKSCDFSWSQFATL